MENSTKFNADNVGNTTLVITLALYKSRYIGGITQGRIMTILYDRHDIEIIIAKLT